MSCTWPPENVADICLFNSKITVSTYNATVETQDRAPALLPFPLTKICQLKDFLLGISYTNGVLVVLDEHFGVVETHEGLEQPLFIASNGERAAVATTQGVVIYEPQGTGVVPLQIQIGTGSLPTALDFTRDKLCICHGCILSILDCDFKEIYRKEFTACINTVSLNGDRVAVGLIDGRIHYEDVQRPDEAFTFNSHMRVTGTSRLHCPVMHVELGETLLSGGYDGRVIKWDVDGKKQVLVPFECEGFVRKFVAQGNELYSVVELGASGSEGNRIRHSIVN